MGLQSMYPTVIRDTTSEYRACLHAVTAPKVRRYSAVVVDEGRGGAPTRSLDTKRLNLRLRQALRSANRAELYNTFKEAVKSPAGPSALTPAVYHHLASKFSRVSDEVSAKRYLRIMLNMKRAKVEMTLKERTAYMTALRATDRAGAALEVYRAGLTQDANVVPDVRYYNSGVNACVDLGDLVEGERIVRDMTKAGLTTDTHTWIPLISGALQLGNKEKAVEFYVKMQHRVNQVIDVDAQLACVILFLRGGMFDQAMVIYKMMLEQGVAIQDTGLALVLNSFARFAGDPDALQDIMARSTVYDPKLLSDPDFYLIHVRQLVRMQRPDLIELYLGTMRSRNVEVQSEHYNMLLKAHLELGNDVEVGEIFGKMKSRADMPLPNAATYDLLLQRRFDLKLRDDVLGLLKEMKERNITYDASTLWQVLRGFSHIGGMDELLFWANEVMANEVRLSANTYNLVWEIMLARARFKKHQHKTSEIHSSILEKEVPPCPPVSCYLDATARQLWSHMVYNENIKVSKGMYRVCISYFLIQNDYAAVLLCLECMRTRHALRPNLRIDIDVMEHLVAFVKAERSESSYVLGKIEARFDQQRANYKADRDPFYKLNNLEDFICEITDSSRHSSEYLEAKPTMTQPGCKRFSQQVAAAMKATERAKIV